MVHKLVVLGRDNILRIVLLLARILLIALAITAILVPIWGFRNSLRPAVPTLDEYDPVDEAAIDPSGDLIKKKLLPYSIEIWVHFKSIQPADRAINLDVSLVVNNRSGLSSIIHRSSKESVFVEKEKKHFLDDDEITLLPKYRNLNLNLIMGLRNLENLVTPVPLRRLSGVLDVPARVFKTSTQLSMETAAYSRYPGDWYRAETFIGVQLPPELAWQILDEDSNSIQTYLKFSNELEPKDKSIYLSSGSQFDSLAGISNQDEEVDATSFSVLIERQALPKAFVWVMALTPALLIPVMIIQLIQARKRSQATPSIDQYISLELAAAVLAILPLRQVLVPAEVQGLTTIDYLLGAQLAIFIALVVIQYSSGLANRDSLQR